MHINTFIKDSIHETWASSLHVRHTNTSIKDEVTVIHESGSLLNTSIKKRFMKTTAV